MTPVICGLCHRPIVKGQYITYAHAETTRQGQTWFAHSARPLSAPGGRSTTAAVAPDRSAAGLERPLGSLRGSQSGRGDLTE